MMDSTTIPRQHLLNARALLAALKRQADTGKPGPYVAPDGHSATDEGDLTSVVIDGRVDLLGLAAVVENIVREDRIEVFMNVREDLDKISKALEALPFRDAREPIRLVQEVENVILDVVGEYEGGLRFLRRAGVHRQQSGGRLRVRGRAWLGPSHLRRQLAER